MLKLIHINGINI